MSAMDYIYALGLFFVAIILLILMVRVRAVLINPLFWKYLIEELKKVKK